MKRLWIYRVLERDENTMGLRLGSYQMRSDSFKGAVGSQDLFGMAKQVKETLATFGVEKVGLIFQPPFDLVVDKMGCHDGHEPLEEEEIKKLKKILEA